VCNCSINYYCNWSCSCIENADTPYKATVIINDVQYGSGMAASKKAAKLEAGKDGNISSHFLINHKPTNSACSCSHYHGAAP
jgi:hypothetical protein